jgi:CheY-like chemotaxis protein
MSEACPSESPFPLSKCNSGYELARELRVVCQSHAICLIALTGYGQPEDRARALSAGFDQHLVEPVDSTSLERTLAELASRNLRPVT